MARQLFTNNATSTLSGTLAQGGVSLTCASGEGSKFPSISGADFFYVTLYTKDISGAEQSPEVVKVTTRTGDTFTIERDVESITGQAGGFSYNGTIDPVYVELRWTAGTADNGLQSGDIGVNVQGFDATLTALAGVTTAADKLIYATGSDAFATADLTAAGRALLDDADASAQRVTLGLGNSAVLNTGTSAGTVALGDHAHAGVYEPIFTTLPVSKGGTGAGTLTGIVMGNGTSAMTAAVSGADYVVPGATFNLGTTAVALNRASAALALTGISSIDGSAATWTTARDLAGNSVNGSANVAFANKFIVQGTTDAGLSGAQFLGALATGLLKNTTTTGVLTTAVARTDYAEPTSALATGLLKNTATTGAHTIAVAGIDYQEAQSVTGIVKSSGVTRSAAVAGTDYQLPIGTISGLAKGNGANALTAATASDVTGQLITGFVSGAGAVAATDTVLQAINKLDGNDAAKVSATGSDGIVTRQMFKDCGLTYYDSTTTNALDYVNGSCQRWAPNTGAQSLTITNWPPTGNLGELLIQGVNLGAATITWPAACLFIKSDGSTSNFAGSGITLQTSGTDWVIMWTRDSGTTLYVKVVR